MNFRKFFSRLGLAFFVLIVADLGVQVVLETLIDHFAPWLLASYTPVYWLVTFLPQYAVGFPLCALILRKLPAMQLFKGRMTAGKWMCLLCITEFFMICGNIIGRILTAIIQKGSDLTVSNDVEDLMEGSSLWLVFLFMVIVGPIMEELVFRKLLLDRLVVFGDLAAILVSAGIFALMHGNLYQVFYAFGVGIIFGYIYIRTGKIGYTIPMHMTINCLGSFLPLLALQAINNQTHLLLGILGELLMIVAEIVLFIVGLVFFIIDFKKRLLKPGEYQMEPGRLAKSSIVNVGMLLFLAVIALVFILDLI